MSMVDYKNKKNKRNQSESDKKTTLKKDPSLRIKRRVLERLSRSLSSKENDVEIKLFFPDEVKDTKPVKLHQFGGFDKSLMHWEEKYPALRDILMSGKYILYEGFLCIPSNKCFSYSNGKIEGDIKYLREHWNELCVSATFIERYDNYQQDKFGFLPPVLLRKTKTLIEFNRAEKENDPSEKTIEIPDSDFDILFPPPGGGDDPFSKMLKEVMKGPPRVTVQELADRTGIPYDTITKMRNRKIGGAAVIEQDPVGIKNIIACIVGLHIQYPENMMLIAKGGHHLRIEIPAEHAYLLICQYYYNYSVRACNAYLVRNNLKPLTDNDKILYEHYAF